MNNRKEKLLSLCKKGKTEVYHLVDEILFIESELRELKKLPFYKVNQADNLKQKLLPAGRIYKDMLQQYNQCLKVFAGLTGNNAESEESPLRKWVKKQNADSEKKHMDTG